MFRPLLPLALCLLTLSIHNLSAKLFEDGDFTAKSASSGGVWQGDAKLLYLKPDGTTSMQAQAGSVPVMQLNLNDTNFQQFSQRFTTPAKTGAIDGEIVVKASADFKINDKSPAFTAGNTWTAGGHWFSRTPSFPKTNLILCIDKSEGYFYQLDNIPAGGDWQTIKLHFANMAEIKAVRFSVIVPPGTGYLLVKSVKIDYVPADPMQFPQPAAKGGRPMPPQPPR